MHATYELRLDDLQAFVNMEKTRSKVPRVVLIGSSLIYLSVLAYAFVKLSLNAAFVLLLPAMFFAITVIRAMRATAPGRAKMKNNFCGNCVLKIELDGLKEVQPNGELKRSWPAIDRIVKTNTHIFIYATGLIAFIVPRRAFVDDAEFSRFVKAIEERAVVTVTTDVQDRINADRSANC